MATNDELIQRFYSAFAAKDGDGMAACYAPDVEFSDPVFPDLRGRQAGDMWRMLTSQPGPLTIELLEHEAEGDRGSAHWRATYEFSQTGRTVVNDIRAQFRFRDGLISEHRDSFSFWKWSRQALGAPGLLLGWTPVLRGKVRRMAGDRLDRFPAAPAG